MIYKNLNSTYFTLFILSSVFWAPAKTIAQIAPANSSEIEARLQKLGTIGSVLYVAAHPDDENTRLLTYLSNDLKVRTSYLSLTRGDGGQNLVGNEQGAALGVIRTQELLAARRIDGAEQYFTRAIDFGYSRSPEETLNKWDKDSILADVVWCIRKLKPDVVITRFPSTGEGGHGHHTASAILANEAFKLSNDPKVFPEQLNYTEPWQPRRILFNSFNFRSRPVQDYTGQVELDVGGYDPLLGYSYGEIAANSRSQHKSQGFGVSSSRGELLEHFVRIDGDTAIAQLFEGLDFSWSRLKGSSNIKKLIEQVQNKFDPNSPDKIVGDLITIRKALANLPDQYWRNIKTKEVDELLALCSGIFLEATVDRPSLYPGQTVDVEISTIGRLPSNTRLIKVSCSGKDTITNTELPVNKPVEFKLSVKIPSTMQITNPYWLDQEPTINKNIYTVSSQSMIGLADNESGFTAGFEFDFSGQSIKYNIPVTYKSVDPVKGEVILNTKISDEWTVSPESKSFVILNDKTITIPVSVMNLNEGSAEVSLIMPKGWTCLPEKYNTGILKVGSDNKFEFSVTPPSGFSKDGKEVEIDAVVNSNGRAFTNAVQFINHDHIPPQQIISKANIKLVPMMLIGNDMKVGYIEGAGDKVAECLKKAGFSITILTESDVINADLNEYPTIITGIRAYNTNEWMMQKNEKLLEYVKNGGNLIVQYNTNSFFGSLENNIGPYPFKITRNRVTVEETKPEINNPESPVFNFPNKITGSDYNGWVQERGLYFAGDIGSEYQRLISWNDPGEEKTDGALITCTYGNGTYTYTGISFFRQLPAGVPGAYRLITNLINLRNETGNK